MAKAKQSGRTNYGNNEKGRRDNRSVASKSYGDKRSYSEKKERRPYRSEGDENANPNLLIGRNPVSEAIKAGRTIDKILMQKDAQGSALKIAKEARDAGIQVQYVDKMVLDKLAPGRPHQGIAAYAAAHAYADLKEMVAKAKKNSKDPVLVILDNLEDPHNLGAIIRTVDGAGFDGVIIPNRRSVSLTETVAKASAGAIEYVPVAKVANLANTVDYLKEEGFWIAAVDMDGENYASSNLSGPLAIIIGAEGFGVSELLRKKSDFIVSIPMRGKVNSLNASNAAAIIIYEALRQRG